jgi:hypothetical protein
MLLISVFSLLVSQKHVAHLDGIFVVGTVSFFAVFLFLFPEIPKSKKRQTKFILTYVKLICWFLDCSHGLCIAIVGNDGRAILSKVNNDV